ncbi:MAG: aminotransferase class I/II-fold pyridoxal phosphate-dependent enzyme [Clostridiales bacterium]|nr:aminotransferase class I/II-fold pyridoxal phosphate-dependent enzyme [Clostridiales bacterium]
MNLYENLISYADTDYYPFHMPGHKRRKFLEEKSPYSYDITEINGFDNLHDAEGIIAEEMMEAAKLYHTKNTYFLVNGSTCGLLSAISAVTNPKDTILVARNCHKAVYNAILIRELKPLYLYPTMLSDYNIAGVIRVEDVKAAFSENKKISAVVITSPTYDGVVSDIEAIAKVVHENGSVLIVDEAHGAHFPFCEEFPKSAIEYGADLVIQSVHKTLPSLTQTALLHRVTDRVEERKVHKYLGIYQSSSPSYVLMGSIVRCMDYLKNSKQEFIDYCARLNHFYDEVKLLKNIVVLKNLNFPQIFKKDDTKVIILAKSGEISGVWLYEQLLEEYHIQPEMVTKDYVTCLSTVCDTQEGFNRLRDALIDIDRKLEAMSHSSQGRTTINHDSEEFLRNELVYLPCEVDQYRTESIKLNSSEGYVAAEYVYLYPPGIPIVVPGERISKELIERLAEYKAAGLSIKGMQDLTGKRIEVIGAKMGKIFMVTGKSATGKDTIYKCLLEQLKLTTIVSYTTRPIRNQEVDGVEYHFVTVERLHELEEEGKVIEHRCYHTVCGDWHYFTVNDGQFDREDCNYILIGTLEQYERVRNYFGKDRVVPIYIEVDGAERLIRSVKREKQQDEPKYAEVCRRFLADEADFSEENIQRLGITKRYENVDLNLCVEEIIRDIRAIL